MQEAVETVGAESVRVKGHTKPLQQFLTFGVFGIRHGLDQIFIAGSAAAIFRRAGAGADETGGGADA